MLKISDQFSFGLKTLIPVSNLTYQIYLTHNLIKTIHTFLHYNKKHTSQTKNLLNNIATPKTSKTDPFLDLKKELFSLRGIDLKFSQFRS